MTDIRWQYIDPITSVFRSGEMKIILSHPVKPMFTWSITVSGHTKSKYNKVFTFDSYDAMLLFVRSRLGV